MPFVQKPNVGIIKLLFDSDVHNSKKIKLCKNFTELIVLITNSKQER